jgi:hypothetical protein
VPDTTSGKCANGELFVPLPGGPVTTGVCVGSNKGQSGCATGTTFAPLNGSFTTGACVAATAPPPLIFRPAEFAITPLDDDEKSVLSQYILGHSMPYPSSFDSDGNPVQTDNPPLTFDEMERVRLWIAQGAPVPLCDLCLQTP